MSAMTMGDRARWVVRGIGEVFITLGALLLLMCVYQLWWTNVVSAKAIEASRAVIATEWHAEKPEPGVTASPTPSVLPEPKHGQGFALLYIPRMRDKVWGLPIIQGTDKDVLARGAGHYENSVMPGGLGNFAIAAHRSTHDEPFANIDDLRVGDKVYVQTATTWYTYTLRQDNPNLTPYDVWVVDPVPGRPDAKPTEHLLTMTTCTPRYGSTGRWAWWGLLSGERAVSLGPPDGLTGTVAS